LATYFKQKQGTQNKGEKMKKQFVIDIVGMVIMIVSFMSVHQGDVFGQEGKIKTSETSAQTISLSSASPKENTDPGHVTEEILKGDVLLAKEHNDRAIMYLKKDQYDLALSEFDEALEIYPLSAGIYNNRGVTYSKKGDYDRAIADFTKAVQLDPNAPEAYFNRGLAYAAKGRINYALADIEKCIDLDPANAAAYDVRGSLITGLACSDWGIACRLGNCDHLKKSVKIGLCHETTEDPLAMKF
jgi:tetratricopeptide (TPR) repeat protein